MNYYSMWIICLIVISICLGLYFYMSCWREDFRQFPVIKRKIDEGALLEYVNAKGDTYYKYKKAIITDKHSDIVKKIETQYLEDIASRDESWIKETHPWSLAITDGSIEYGYAFTVGTTMYLPIDYLSSNERIHSLWRHELRHIWQRQNYREFIKQIEGSKGWEDWKFKIVDNIEDAVQMIRRVNREAVINPDTVQVMAYVDGSKQPIYPVMQNGRLVYIMGDDSVDTWEDPHPCELDAREMED